jgi:lipoprotein-releasing system ATP-binding protein
MQSLLKISNLNKTFEQGREVLQVLKNLNLEINSGELIALVGQSGSGKSTLLQILGTLMSADNGDIEILGKNISKLSDNQKTELRLKNIGFVYQYHHLLSDFTALQNVMLPQLIAGVDKKLAKKNSENLLEKIGLKERIKHKPFQLSGGQQQRVAIARALANNPKLVIADEPTGNLDSANSENIIELFLNLVKENQTTLVIATHNKEISSKSSRIITIKDGTLI